MVLAIACLVAAVYHARVIIELNERGVKASATVVDFHRGARNSKWAIYHYTLPDGQQMTTRDIFQQYVKGVEEGDQVDVIYDRDDTGTVTADLGMWIWQAPAIFGSGFVVLSVLSILIWRHRGT